MLPCFTFFLKKCDHAMSLLRIYFSFFAPFLIFSLIWRALAYFSKAYNIWGNLCPDRGSLLTLTKNDERFSLIVRPWKFTDIDKERWEIFIDRYTVLHVSSWRTWMFSSSDSESPYFTTHTLKHVETLCRRIWLQKWAKPWILSIHFSCTRSTLDKQTWPGRGDENIILFI